MPLKLPMNLPKKSLSSPPSISVFFPAYNEEENIEKVVQQAQKVLKSLFFDFEIIVIDDGSRDRTGKIIDRLAKLDPKFKAIHHLKNRGYGAALTTGFQNAKKDLVFFTDSDLQFDFSEIKKFLKYLPAYDMVIGYRLRRESITRTLNAFCWRQILRNLFGLRVRDPNCAFKLFKRKTIENLKFTSEGAMVSAEFLIKILHQGYKIKQLPVRHFPRKAGKSSGASLKVILKALRELLIFLTKTHTGYDG